MKNKAFEYLLMIGFSAGIFVAGMCVGCLYQQAHSEPVVITQIEEIEKIERVEVPVKEVITVEVQKVVPRRIEVELSDSDKELIARVVMAEAAYEDPVGKRLVVDTILNRVDSPAFPNTVHGVIYQDNQFYKAYAYSTECMDAVEHEIYERTDYDVLWFAADGYQPYGIKAYQHGGHYFNWRTKE